MSVERELENPVPRETELVPKGADVRRDQPKVLGDEPPDVVSYAKQNLTFPHQSTANQWFDESQTESYRMLGKVTIDSICGNWQPDGRIADLAHHVSTQYLGMKEAAANA